MSIKRNFELFCFGNGLTLNNTIYRFDPKKKKKGITTYERHHDSGLIINFSILFTNFSKATDTYLL